MEILNYEQGSPEWFKARIGSIGGSSISAVVAKGQGKMRNGLLYQLAGEILSGQKYEGYRNEHMERGVEQEAQARSMYEFTTDTVVKHVGIIKKSPHKHYSPDGLVGEEGMIEIKCTIPKVHVETIITEVIDGSYIKQIQWGLGISNRGWCDFISYSPLVIDKPIWIKRVSRDEKMIKELGQEADKFIEELLKIVEKIRREV